MVASLTLVDSMMLYGVIPALFGIGSLMTSTYLNAKALRVPLWYSRKVARLATIAVFIYLVLGYLTFQREMQMNDNRTVMHNI